MRDPNRIDTVLAALQEVWTLCPDLRFGQLIENIIYKYDSKMSLGHMPQCLWNWEEEVWLAAIEKFKENMQCAAGL